VKKSLQVPALHATTLTICALLLVLMPSQAFMSVPPVFAIPSPGPIQRHTLPGHLVPLLKKVPPIGQTPQSTSIQLSIGLALQHPQTLNTLLAAQADPASAFYHTYITPQEFNLLFGPHQTTVNQIVTYLHGEGLNVESIASNSLFITASGTAAIVEKAFNTTLKQYRLNGRVVYAPSVDPSVPDDIAPAIQTIGGLDNVAHYHPLGLQRQALQHGSARLPSSPTPGYTPSEIATAYHLTPLHNAAANGTGQTIALFELDGYNPTDITTYRKNNHLDVSTPSNILVNGASNTQGSGSIEASLDMEMVSALAPGATQKIYIGPNSVAGVNATYNQIVTDDTASVVSTSWGECEEASGNAELQALDNIFKQGMAQGQSFFAASGDAGAYDCQNTDLAVDTPADDPNVIGVGGTTLHTKQDGTYDSETAWSKSSDLEKVGSGGGISGYFLRPAYQHDLTPSNPYRLVPDVSANADPETGYEIYCTGVTDSCTGWLKIGGTSAAAPLWAAIAADVNQYLTAQHDMPLGNANATFYTLATTPLPLSAFHDITEGNNLYYSAHIGYDMATGLGTPDAWNLARDVATLFSRSVPPQGNAG
jgi:subtilase family serine protease